MTVIAFPGGGKGEPAPAHSPTLCAAGECPHGSPLRKIPCRCEICDADTRAYVDRNRAEALRRIVDGASQATPRFADRKFEHFDVSLENRAAYEAAQAVMDDPRVRGLGLYGDPGVGKSHLAAAIVNGCITVGVPAVYVSVEELLGRLRETFNHKTPKPTENEIINGAATVAVLALDDLGKESLSDYTVRTLYAIVNRRYEQKLPLIVTSNFSLPELSAREVGDKAEPLTYTSTIDRIREMTGKWISVGGRSRR